MKFPKKKIEKSNIKPNVSSIVDDVEFEIKPKKKEKPLSKQDKIFVNEVVKTGNKTQAVKKAYGIKDEKYASVKGVRLIGKDSIVKAVEKKRKTIAEQLSDDILIKAHKELLQQTRADYFVFPKSMMDDEIMGHVEGAGFKVITIRLSDKGKMAFYSVADAMAKKGALEMAYKIRGDYAPEKKELTGANGDPLFTNEHKKKSADAIQQIIS